MFKKLKIKISKELGFFDYGTKCHGYDIDGNHAHFYRCYDDDCPQKIQPNEYYDKEDGKWKFR